MRRRQQPSRGYVLLGVLIASIIMAIISIVADILYMPYPSPPDGFLVKEGAHATSK